MSRDKFEQTIIVMSPGHVGATMPPSAEARRLLHVKQPEISEPTIEASGAAAYHRTHGRPAFEGLGVSRLG